MVAPEFTIEGISIQTFDEIFEELAEGYRAIYGQDINLDQDSPDGQRIAIEAKARLDLQTFAAQLYSQIDPDFSAGDFQNKIIKWAGIERGPATKSTVDVTITTDRNITLEAGYIVKDLTEQEWETTDENSLVIGANTITLTAVLFGNVEADADTITEPITIVLGVLSVTNPLAATSGLDEETDEELRIRRNQSLENASYSTTGGLFAKLANLTGVDDLAVYENDTKIDDPITGIDANSLWVVILGGEVSDIAEVIAKNKTGGTGLKGIEEATFEETVIRPDGTDFIIEHEIKYDRPTDVPLFITLTAVTKDPSNPVDEDLIKAKIAGKNYTLNETAVASELYAFGYQAGTHLILTDLLISDDDVIFVDDDITNDLDQRFTIDVANITIS